MKLSTAILLGSIGSEQGFGYQTGYSESQKKCALGAAYLAIGKKITFGDDNGGPVGELTDIWPWAREIVEFPCDVSHYIIVNRHVEVYHAIWLLNDVAKWTRPQIAAWVATIEPQELEYKPLLTPTSCEQECKA